MKKYKSHFIKEKKTKLHRISAVGAVIWTASYFLVYLYFRTTAYHVRYPDPIRFAIFSFLDTYLLLWWGLGLLITILSVQLVIYHRIVRSFDATLDFMKHPEQKIPMTVETDEIYNLLEYYQNQLHDNTQVIKQEQQRKNDLVVYLAHDLKTPLTSIQGYLDIILEQPEIPEELRMKYVGIALDKAERLEELINEFFDISRFNLTDIQVQCSKINFARLLEQEIFEFGPMLKEKALNCELDISEDFTCFCDPDKMQRVIDNLLRNAVNYSYSNSIIYIKVAEDAKNNYIMIRNQGDTISKESLERLFDQFFRLDTSRNSKTGGSGIGLAIAKKIVQAHGGKITAESKNSQITFNIILPK